MEDKSTHVTLEEVPLPDADLWTITRFAQRTNGYEIAGSFAKTVESPEENKRSNALMTIF